MSVIAHFDIEFTRFINPDGKAAGDDMPAFAGDRDAMIRLYRWMVLNRTFDAKAITLQRSGRLGTYASSLGQEGVNIGVADAMSPYDVLLPSFREHGAQLVRGVTSKELFQYWGGDERGSNFSGPKLDFPVSIPVGSHAAHAAGAALAFSMRGEKRAAVAIFGDGATSKGDVYEAMNISGAWTLPVVFVVNNNQWAISVPRGSQTAAQTLAQKAIAAGFEGCQVDGNDVVAVRHVTERALIKAKEGHGPTLIEALTYRLGDHTTVDDARRYRNDSTVSAHWKTEPILRTRLHLTNVHGWTKDEEHALLTACRAEIDAAADDYLAGPPPPVESMFDYLHEVLPDGLREQRAALLREAT